MSPLQPPPLNTTTNPLPRPPNVTNPNSSQKTDTILCLHGYGTSSSILHLQLRALATALAEHNLHLAIPDAPFSVSAPGPGTLPAFADGPRPFRRWHTDATLAKLFGVSDQVVEEERGKVKEVLRESVKKVEEEGSGRVVGLLGFSQGAGLAAGICMDPELGGGVEFVVCVCGLYPALRLGVGEEKTDVGGRINLPSVHVLGARDGWKGQGVKIMEEYFVQEKVRMVECQIGHEMPSRPKDVAAVVNAVLEAWREAQEAQARQQC